MAKLIENSVKKVPVSDNVTNKLVRLKGAFKGIFREAMDWAENDFQEEIKTRKWDWPNDTFRANGKRVGAPRDIVDLGGLMRSQKRENIGDNKTIFTWTGADPDGSEEEYALEVHEGYTDRDTGERRLARPFTEHAIEELPSIVEQLLMKEAKANG